VKWKIADSVKNEEPRRSDAAMKVLLKPSLSVRRRQLKHQIGRVIPRFLYRGLSRKSGVLGAFFTIFANSLGVRFPRELCG
jgi:hypothetical protein